MSPTVTPIELPVAEVSEKNNSNESALPMEYSGSVAPAPAQAPAPATPQASPKEEDSSRGAVFESSGTDRELREVFSGPELPRWRKWALFSCSCLLQYLLQLDMSAVAVTLPSIAKELRASQVVVFTVATGYFLAQTVFQLVFSHVSHALGRKYAYMSGVGLYIVGAIVGATSHGTEQLIGGRVIQGTGAAGMCVMSAIVIVDIMLPRQRAVCMSLSQASSALGNMCGPIFAGLLLKGFTWRSIFWLEIIFAGILLVTLSFSLPDGHRPADEPPRRVLARYDWVGMVVFLMGSVLILVPINIGGTVRPWGSAPVISCLVAGLACLAFLGYHQRCVAEHPVFPRELFARPVTNAAFLGCMVVGMLLSMIFYNLVLFWQAVRHLPTIRVSVVLLSLTLTYTAFVALTGIVVKTTGSVRWATIAGTVASTAGLGLMWFMTSTTALAGLILISMLSAAGCGMLLTAMINTIVASTHESWHSHAIAMRMLLHTAGQCIGISVGLAIFTNKFKFNVKKADSATGLSGQDGAEGDIAVTPQSLMQLIKDLKPDSEVTGLIVNALRWVWGAGCVLIFVTMVPVCVLKCPHLPKDGKTVPDEQGHAGGVRLPVDKMREHETSEAPSGSSH